MHLLRSLILGGLVAAVALPGAASAADEWGAVKGQVVWAGGKIPARKKLNVTTNVKECLKNGDLLSTEYVIDPGTKGVRYAIVWLMPADPKVKTPPIHPSLKTPPKKVVLDQPCCMFEPHVLGIREGQVLEVKNSAEITHNVNISSPKPNPNINLVVGPHKSIDVEGWKAAPYPSGVACNIHPWMKGNIWVFDHPYFVLTDAKGQFEIKNAPAGKYRLVVWQEGAGWVIGGKSPKAGGGKVITIKKDGTTDVGKIDLKPSDD
jgi:hypothetical protein